MEEIVGKDVNNFLVARRLLALGDAMVDVDVEGCIKKDLLAHKMIKEMLSINHIAMVNFNNKLANAYHQKLAEEGYKERVTQLLEDNMKIARQTFKETSIHLLYHVHCYLVH